MVTLFSKWIWRYILNKSSTNCKLLSADTLTLSCYCNYVRFLMVWASTDGPQGILKIQWNCLHLMATLLGTPYKYWVRPPLAFRTGQKCCGLESSRCWKPSAEILSVIVMSKKPVWDDLSFVTWHIILLEVAIWRWVHCGHKAMDMINNNTQVGCGF